MTTATTQINITAKDSTAAAFASADKNLSGLSSTALKVGAGLAAVGVSVAGVVSAVKGIAQATIQFQQFTNTLQVGTGSATAAADALSFVRSESQRLGLDLATAADQFGKLAAASKGTALEGKATRDIFTSVAQAATALGLSAEQTGGSLLAIQQIISKGTVSAEELRGQLGERLPGAFQIAARAIGVTTQELDKLLRTGSITAEQLLPALSRELDKTFGSQSEQAAQGLTAQMNRMNTAIFDLKIAIGESGLINFLSSGIELATKLANALTSAFGGGSQRLSPIEKQISLIKQLEGELESLQNKAHVPLIGDLLFDKKEADLLKFRIESAVEDLAKMKAAVVADGNTETVITAVTKDTEKLSVATKKTISDAERFLSSLKKEAETAGLTSVEMKRLEAAHLGVSKAANPLISRIEQVTNEMDAQKAAAQALSADLQKIASITESVKTKEERLIDTQTELNRLLNLPNSNLSIETYNRALQKAQDETRETARVTRSTTDEMGQMWIQAGRNIQTALGNLVFDSFNDGLKGMVRNAGNAALRIMSEFAGLKIAQSIGLAGMFGASGVASASSGAGLLNLASLGSNASSFVNSGFGITSLAGRGLSSLGGSIGAFGGGLAGSSAGIFSNVGGAGTAFIGGPGTALGGSGLGGAASLGASTASLAGGLAGAGLGVFGGSLIAGDKKLAGLSGTQTAAIGTAIGFAAGGPIGAAIGGLVAGLGNALFGRGPYKFRQQSIQGTASSEGFDGDISNVFRAKGGLLRSNGHKTVTEQFTLEQQTLLDDTLNGFFTSSKKFAENLGLSASLVDNFTQEVQIKSEKGKQVTEEAIAEMLDGIGNSLAQNVLPIVDTLRKAGEDSFATLTRLNSEFVSLASAVQNLGGSTEYAKGLITALSFETRTKLVEMAGGFESLATMSGFFFSNFLSAEEQLAVKTDQLNQSLIKLGLSTALAVNDYKKLIQAEGTANDVRIALLQLAPAFLEVRNAQTQLASSTNVLAKAERSLNDIRSELLGKYNQERGELESTISKFKGISDKLKDFREGLAFSELSPLTPAQKLEQARANFNQVRSKAAAGDEAALDQLPTVAQEFLRASQTYNASSAAYLSDFALVTNVLKNAEKTALSQSDIARSQLDHLKSSVDYLLNIDNTTKTTNDLLKELIAATLSGSGNPAISTNDIKGFLASNPGLSPSQVASAATRYGVSNAQLSAAGYDVSLINKSQGGATVTDKQILDFVNANRNDPMAIYNAARANGVTSQRLSQVGGISLSDINKFVKDNKLPAFERGTNFVQKTGLAMVHKAEAIVPSSAMTEFKSVKEEISALRKDMADHTGALIKVTDITSRQNAKVISETVEKTGTQKSWTERNKVGLR